MATMTKEYRIFEANGRKGLMVDGELVLSPKFERISVKIPGENNVSSSLPYVIVIARDIDWNYEIIQLKPLFEGTRVVSRWCPPVTVEHSGWHLEGTKLRNREMGIFYLDGRRFGS